MRNNGLFRIITSSPSSLRSLQPPREPQPFHHRLKERSPSHRHASSAAKPTLTQPNAEANGNGPQSPTQPTDASSSRTKLGKECSRDSPPPRFCDPSCNIVRYFTSRNPGSKTVPSVNGNPRGELGIKPRRRGILIRKCFSGTPLRLSLIPYDPHLKEMKGKRKRNGKGKERAMSLPNGRSAPTIRTHFPATGYLPSREDKLDPTQALYHALRPDTRRAKRRGFPRKNSREETAPLAKENKIDLDDLLLKYNLQRGNRQLFVLHESSSADIPILSNSRDPISSGFGLTVHQADVDGTG